MWFFKYKIVVLTVMASTLSLKKATQNLNIHCRCRITENTTRFVFMIYFYGLPVPTSEFWAELWILDPITICNNT